MSISTRIYGAFTGEINYNILRMANTVIAANDTQSMRDTQLVYLEDSD